MADTNMIAAVITGPGEAQLRELPVPEPGPGEVRVKVEGCGVCGSNLALWEGRPWFRYPVEPGSPGHEGWGVIDRVGDAVSKELLGQRVSMLSYRAFAQYDVVGAHAVVPSCASSRSTNLGALHEKFDWVLFTGVFYHLRYPLLALDLVREHVASGHLVFQSMLRGSPEVAALEPDYPFSERAIFELPGFPRMCFIEQRYSQDPTNWWVPNRACVEALLRSAGFEIESQPEEEVFVCKPVDTPRDWPERSLLRRTMP